MHPFIHLSNEVVDGATLRLPPTYLWHKDGESCWARCIHFTLLYYSWVRGGRKVKSQPTTLRGMKNIQSTRKGSFENKGKGEKTLAPPLLRLCLDHKRISSQLPMYNRTSFCFFSKLLMYNKVREWRTTITARKTRMLPTRRGKKRSKGRVPQGNNLFSLFLSTKNALFTWLFVFLLLSSQQHIHKPNPKIYISFRIISGVHAQWIKSSSHSH